MDLGGTIVIAAGLLLLLIGLLAYASSGGQEVDASGRPVEVTGEAAMERKVLLTLVLLFSIGGLFIIYAVLEPSRQAAAQSQQDDISIRRGIETYATLCYTCHGEDGRGAVVPGSDPPRVAPALNRPDLRPTDPDAYRQTYDLVFRTISRGRPNTPMPAWSRSEGGALLDEYINELTLMITHGDKVIELGGKRATVWEHVHEVVQEKIAHGSPTPIPVPEVQIELPEEAKRGLDLWKGEAACIGCHVIDGIGGGQTGPNLSDIGNVAATRKPGMSAEEYIRESILDPNAYVVEGFPPAMPSYQGRLTEEQLNDLVSFYMTLKK